MMFNACRNKISCNVTDLRSFEPPHTKPFRSVPHIVPPISHPDPTCYSQVDVRHPMFVCHAIFICHAMLFPGRRASPNVRLSRHVHLSRHVPMHIGKSDAYVGYHYVTPCTCTFVTRCTFVGLSRHVRS